jgi:hypothetical protein
MAFVPALGRRHRDLATTMSTLAESFSRLHPYWSQILSRLDHSCAEPYAIDPQRICSAPQRPSSDPRSGRLPRNTAALPRSSGSPSLGVILDTSTCPLSLGSPNLGHSRRPLLSSLKLSFGSTAALRCLQTSHRYAWCLVPEISLKPHALLDATPSFHP